MNENTETAAETNDEVDGWDAMTVEQIERMAEMAAWKEVMGYV